MNEQVTLNNGFRDSSAILAAFSRPVRHAGVIAVATHIDRIMKLSVSFGAISTFPQQEVAAGGTGNFPREQEGTVCEDRSLIAGKDGLYMVKGFCWD